MKIAALVLGFVLFSSDTAWPQAQNPVTTDTGLVGARTVDLDIGTLLQSARNLKADEGVGLGVVIDALGIPPNFSVKVVQMPRANAAATFYAGNRYLFVDESFIVELDAGANNWHAIAVAAHEIGHHLAGHTLAPNSKRIQAELEADRFAGQIMAYLGADLDELISEVEPFFDDAATATHPSRANRVEALSQGWQQGSAALAKAQVSRLCREMLKLLDIHQDHWTDWTQECQKPQQLIEFIESPGKDIVQMLDLLLRLGNDPNAQDEKGNTFFHHVVNSKNPHCDGMAEKVDLLLAHGADPTIKNNDGETPISLLWGAWGGDCYWLANGQSDSWRDHGHRHELARLIVHHALVTDTSEEGYRWPNYFEVAKTGRPSDFEPYLALRYPSDFVDHDGNTAMHLAAMSCNTKLFEGMVDGTLPDYPSHIPARIANNVGQKPHELAKACNNISTELIGRVEFQSN